MTDVEIIIDGRKNKEDYNKHTDKILKIIQEKKQPFLLIGVISEKGRTKSFAINNASVPETLGMILCIKKIEKQMVKSLFNQLKDHTDCDSCVAKDGCSIKKCQ